MGVPELWDVRCALVECRDDDVAAVFVLYGDENESWEDVHSESLLKAVASEDIRHEQRIVEEYDSLSPSSQVPVQQHDVRACP